MKNQDIFEVFKHLKTLLGGNSSLSPKKTGNEKGEGKPAPTVFSEEEKETRLREFHLKHEALARKILQSSGAPHQPCTHLALTPKKDNGQRESTPRAPNGRPAAFPVEREETATLPLFPPSLPQ